MDQVVICFFLQLIYVNTNWEAGRQQESAENGEVHLLLNSYKVFVRGKRQKKKKKVIKVQ